MLEAIIIQKIEITAKNKIEFMLRTNVLDVFNNERIFYYLYLFTSALTFVTSWIHNSLNLKSNSTNTIENYIIIKISIISGQKASPVWEKKFPLFQKKKPICLHLWKWQKTVESSLGKKF